MLSTVPNTSSPSTELIELNKEKAPKIVEFTLGNMGSSCAKSGFSEGGEVSEFSAKVSSKQIKEKLMKLK